jgi:predicted Rossmann-fold nucleotide-binding protein
VILYGSAYWKEILNFEALSRHGMIAEEDLRLFEYAEDPAGALRLLQKRLVEDAKEEPSPAFAHSHHDGKSADREG